MINDNCVICYDENIKVTNNVCCGQKICINCLINIQNCPICKQKILWI